MILNPVIQGGGAEKVYKITDSTNAGFPATAKAGECRFTKSDRRLSYIDTRRAAYSIWIKLAPSIKSGGKRLPLFHHARTGCNNHLITLHRKAVAV
mgnify:FL=1